MYLMFFEEHFAGTVSGKQAQPQKDTHDTRERHHNGENQCGETSPTQFHAQALQLRHCGSPGHCRPPAQRK